jgi:multidrug efflux pump subunit AcrA (membrane-fusion protein)
LANIKPGTVVSPNPNLPAFRVVGFRELKVTAEVSEAYAAKVKKGDKVMIQFPDLNQEIESTISFVSNYIEPVNRIFMIESRIEQDVPGMKANMVAIVRINDYHSENSIKLPMNVVMTDLNGSYVYVARKKDNYFGAFKQPVVIGNIYNGVAEITSGLNSEDKVITTGFQELVDGEYVRINKPSEAYVGK